jgi:hypothetical protein
MILLLTTLTAVLAGFIIHLLNRVQRLEKSILRSKPPAPVGTKPADWDGTLQPVAHERDLVNLVNRMYTAVLRPDPVEVENVQAEDLQNSLKLIEHYVGPHLFHHIPALRRVLKFDIGVSWEFLQATTAVIEEDLRGLDAQRSPNRALWPATSVVIEEWATHTVIRDFAGLRDVLYSDRTDYRLEGALHAYVVWRHELPKRSGEYDQPYLEVVLHEGCIKFWARSGRFETTTPWEPMVARNEYVLVSIPLNESRLKNFRFDGEPPPAPGSRESKPRLYKHVAADESIRWNLAVHDVVAATR